MREKSYGEMLVELAVLQALERMGMYPYFTSGDVVFLDSIGVRI